VRSFTRAGVRRTRHKLGSFETGTGSSRRACAISMRSKGIAMGPRQCARCHSVTNRDRQAYETWLSITPARSPTIALAAGSLPKRRLVEISQTDAALTKIGSNSSLMALRASELSFSPPASHQRHAWVSGRSRGASLPFRQLGVCHWLEKFRPHTSDALECAELAVGRQRLDGSKTRDRGSTASDVNSGEKLGKIGLRGVYGDNGHQRSELRPYIS
jgi:hypothetical protein